MRAPTSHPPGWTRRRARLSAGLDAAPAGRLALVAFAAEPAAGLSAHHRPRRLRRSAGRRARRRRARRASRWPSRGARALALLESSAGDVVLVSDGEFPDGGSAAFSEAARGEATGGRRISTVGVGTRAGAACRCVMARPGQAACDDQAGRCRRDWTAAVLAGGEGGGRYAVLGAGGQLDLVALTERQRLAGDRVPVRLRPFGPGRSSATRCSPRPPARVDAWLSWRVSGVDDSPLRRRGCVPALVWLSAAGARAQADVAAASPGDHVASTAGRVEEATAAYRRALAIESCLRHRARQPGHGAHRSRPDRAAAETLASRSTGSPTPGTWRSPTTTSATPWPAPGGSTMRWRRIARRFACETMRRRGSTMGWCGAGGRRRVERADTRAADGSAAAAGTAGQGAGA